MPLSDQEIKILLEKAEAYRDKNDLQSLEEALKCYDQLIENASPHPYYFAKRADIKHIILGHISFAPFDLESVIKDISKAIELDPDRGGYYKARGAYLWYGLEGISDKNCLERIKADYNACINKDPTNSGAWIGLIGTNILLHNWDDAIGYYGSCRPFIKTKEDQLIRAWLGCLAFALEGEPIKEEDKRPLYDQTISLPQEDIFSKISAFLKEIHPEEDYSEKWKKAMEIHLLFIEHLCNYNSKGNLLNYLEHYEDALKAYEKSLEMDPDSFVVWDNKGNTLTKLKRYEEALRAFEKSIELKPDDAKSWMAKRNVLVELSRYDEAFRACDKAIELTPDDDKYPVALAFANNLAKLGRYDEALNALDKAIELCPDDKKYPVALGFADKLADLGRYDEALNALDKAIELCPDDKKYPVALGLANNLAKLGRYDEALNALDKAIKNVSIGDDVWGKAWRRRKADILEKLGRHEEARQVFDEAAKKWYTWARESALEGSISDVRWRLSEAIKLDAKYKDLARNDDSFKTLWDNEDFKRIVG
ncbi:MAG: hypothetical protein COW04_08475 [Deltaproteobacteria bacterium CG12_big_fil_rev_8_21_14_0_65_43_10]|nr:MAG: hypothetical protein COW04_08475 [Deltaproteobacteria bacterium CG12_big_fil_rev_8_21_14_0_65_43_10]